MDALNELVEERARVSLEERHALSASLSKVLGVRLKGSRAFVSSVRHLGHGRKESTTSKFRPDTDRGQSTGQAYDSLSRESSLCSQR